MPNARNVQPIFNPPAQSIVMPALRTIPLFAIRFAAATRGRRVLTGAVNAGM